MSVFRADYTTNLQQGDKSLPRRKTPIRFLNTASDVDSEVTQAAHLLFGEYVERIVYLSASDTIALGVLG